MMNIRKLNSSSEAFNLTALLDVIFLLIIFFMLTSKYDRPKDVIKMDLPMSKNTKSITGDNDIVIELSNNSRIMLNGSKKTIEQVYLELKSRSNRKSGVVILRCDKNAPSYLLISVYDMLQELGLYRFAHEVVNRDD